MLILSSERGVDFEHETVGRPVEPRGLAAVSLQPVIDCPTTLDLLATQLCTQSKESCQQIEAMNK